MLLRKIKKMRHNRLSYQILVVFTIVIIVCLGTSGWFMLRISEDIITRKISEGDQHLARRLAREVEAEMASVTPIMKLLAESQGIRIMEPAVVKKEIDQTQKSFPDITSIYVADLEGAQIARSGIDKLEDVSKIWSFQVARGGSELISDIYSAGLTSEPMRTITLPIIDNSTVVGVVSADISFKKIMHSVMDIDVGKNGSVAVIADNGRVVAHTYMDKLQELDLSNSPAVEAVLTGQEGSIQGYTDALGRQVLGSYSPIRELRWGVVIQKPLAAIDAEVGQLRTTILWATIGAIFLAVLSGWLMSKQITKPIRKLARASKRIAQGDLSTPVDVISSNEIGVLAHSFEQMMASLKKSRYELEQRVAIATKEIRQRVDELNTLYEVSKDIISTLEVDTRLQIIVDEAARLVDANKSIILLIDSEKEKLIKIMVHGYNQAELERHTFEEAQDGLSGWVMREKVPTLSADIKTDERNRGRALASAKQSGDKSAAIAPLIIQDLVIGTLTVVSGQRGHTFTPADLDLVTMLAGQAAIAIHNARLYEAAQEADRLKSAFLASMSHELRTPLNSIIGFTGILLQDLVGPLNDEQRKQLGMVRGSAHHLLTLINDVLDISKIEAGQLEILSELFDMRAAIEDTVQIVSPMAEKKDLVLVVDVSPEVDQIVGDRRRVEQILINLVNNAIKFTDKGEVRIESKVCDNRLETSISDTGIGIISEDFEIIFKAFMQVDTGLARLREGTGLGLSICKRLVEMLGGEIYVESERGVGSKFTFTLPVGRSKS